MTSEDGRFVVLLASSSRCSIDRDINAINQDSFLTVLVYAVMQISKKRPAQVKHDRTTETFTEIRVNAILVKIGRASCRERV